MLFEITKLEALCDALASDQDALSHKDISQLLRNFNLPVPPQTINKRSRMLEAFVQSQNFLKNPTMVFRFVEMACDPARFLGRRETHDSFRKRVNSALLMVGKAIGPDGELFDVKTARTVFDAELRANELREIMSGRKAHPDVLRFCNAELLQDNYFHAVMEAVKSMAQKIRDKTGLDGDGQDLVERAFGSKEPYWIINPFVTEAHKKEQSGFCNLLIGIFGMFRNPTAHAPRIFWEMKREDAEDLMSMLSLVHRRIDGANMRLRV